MGMRAGKVRVRTGREAQQIVALALGLALALALALSLALATGASAARECEGPGINHLPEPAASDEVLSVIAYNVYLLPSHVRTIPFMGERFAIAQEERAERIPPFLAPYDVVILSEAYDDDARAMLLDGLRARGFRYSTRILGSACRAASSCKKGTVYEQPLTEGAAPRGGEGDTWFGEDGGVLIASKHPIGAASEWVYADCVEPDCNAAKGFVYARIDKGSARYHVIGTHAQFGWNAEQREAKAAQLSAIRQFLENESEDPALGAGHRRRRLQRPPSRVRRPPQRRAARHAGTYLSRPPLHTRDTQRLGAARQRLRRLRPREARAGARPATAAIARWSSARASTSRTARYSRS